jgi:hypothetical protein
MRRRNATVAVAALIGLALANGSAIAADSPPVPRPIINITDTATVPAKYGWISDDGRKALTDAMSQLKAQKLVAFVFVAAPGGNFWSYRSVEKSTDFLSVEDLARLSLQSCEYFANSPCYVVSVNGFEASDGAGGLQVQPSMLADQPAEFDATRVPFVSAGTWSTLQGYRAVTKAKALVITVNGGWWWEPGDTMAKAVTAADGDCQKADPNNFCILYAVNDRVVFTAGAPH